MKNLNVKNTCEDALRVALMDLEKTTERLERAIDFNEELGRLGRLRADFAKSIECVATLRTMICLEDDLDFTDQVDYSEEQRQLD